MEQAYFKVRGHRDVVFYRPLGSRAENYGGAIGASFQARRVELDPFGLPHPTGDPEWVRCASVCRTMDTYAAEEELERIAQLHEEVETE